MLNGVPSTLIITYTGGSGSPQTVPIPIPQNGSVAGVSQTATPLDFTLAVKNLMLAGGAWYVSGTGVNTFIPWGQITSITAQ